LKEFVILSHNYVRQEVQRMADFVADSLELARKVVDDNVCQGARRALERIFELSTPER
jgi:quinolinate synthase